MTHSINSNKDKSIGESSGRTPVETTQALHTLVPSTRKIASKRPTWTLMPEEQKRLVARGQQLLEERFDKDLLDPKHPGYIDDGLFAHIHGDSYIRDSALEGNFEVNTITHFLYYLEKFQPFEKWHDIFALFKSAPGYAASILTLNSNKKDVIKTQKEIRALSARITSDIFQLSPNQQLIIPGGYTAPGGGHSMLYQITREGDGTFSLEVINTGDGLRYHTPEGLKGKIKYYPFKRYEKIAYDRTLIHDFIQAAIETQVPLAAVDPPYDANYLYQKIFPMLKGIEVPVRATADDVITVQRSGTCSERVIHACCRRHCLRIDGHLTAYKEFKLKFKRQTLIHYFQIKKQALALGEDTTVVNLEKAISKWARSIDKRIQTRGVRDQELEDDIALLEAIQEELTTVKKKLMTIPEHVTAIKIPVKTQHNRAIYRKNVFSLKNKPAEESNVQPVLEPALDRPAKEINSFQALVNCTNYCDQLMQRGTKDDHFEIVQFYNDVVATMSTAMYRSDAITPTQWVKQLEKFNNTAFNALYNLNTQAKTPLTQPFLLHQCYALYLMDFFAKKNPENKLNGFDIDLHLNRLQQRSAFILTDPVHAHTYNVLAQADESRKGYLDLGFASVWLDKDCHSQVNVKFAKQFDRYSSEKTEFERLAEILSDMGDKSLLPPDVLALKKQQFRLKLLLSLSTSGFTWGWHLPPEQIIQKVTSSNPREYQIRSYRIIHSKNTKNEDADVPIEIGDGIIRNDKDEAFLPLYYHLNSEQSEMIQDNGQFQKKTLFKSGIKLTENHVVLSDKTSAWTQEERRDFKTLLVNAGDLPFNTLAVFTKYLPKLSNLGFQNFFDLHFYKPGILSSYLQHHYEFSRDIADFVKKGINFFEPLNNWNACVFFAEFADRFPQYSYLFPNRLNLLRKWFQSAQTPSAKTRIAHHILSAYAKKDRIETKSLEEIFRAYIYAKTNSLPNLRNEYLLIESGEKLVYRLKKMGSTLNNEREMVNSLCETILHDASIKKDIKSVWSGQYPVFETTANNSHYHIDLEKGKILVNGLPCHGLPKNIVENDEFKTLFSANEINASPVDAETFTFNDSPTVPHHNVLIKNSEFGNPTIQRQFDGRWMQLLHYSDFSQHLQCNEITRAGLYQWQECDPAGGMPPKLLITNAAKEPLYEVELTALDGKQLTDGHKQNYSSFEVSNMRFEQMWDIKRITKIGPPRQELVPINRSEKFLESFELGSGISVWAEEKRESEIIKGTMTLSRFGLSFSIENGRAFSQQHPGYYLASSEHWKGLGATQSYLVLRNDNNELKVLLPQWQQKNESDPLKKMLQKSLSVQFTPELDYYAKEVHAFAYDVNKKGELIPKTTEETLYLLYVYLCMGRRVDYLHKALESLLATRLTKPLGERENELLTWILNIKSSTAQMDPEINALRLKLFCLREQNSLDFAGKVPDKKDPPILEAKTLFDLFSYYLSNTSNTKIYALKPHEEECIIRYIDTHCDGTIPEYREQLSRLLNVREGKALNQAAPPPAAIELKQQAWKAEDLQNIYSKLVYKTWLPKEDLDQLSFTYPGEQFLLFFSALVEKAIKGTQSEQEHLLRQMQTMKIAPSDIVSEQLRDYLLDILTAPRSYQVWHFPSGDCSHRPKDYGNYEPTGVTKQFFESIQTTYGYRHRETTTAASNTKEQKKDHLALKPLLESIALKSQEQKKPIRGLQPLILPPSAPAVASLDHYIRFEIIPNPLYDLKEFRFKTNYPDSVTNTYLGHCNQELTDFFTSCQATKQKATLTNAAALRTTLENTIKEDKITLKKKKTDLLQLANKPPKNFIKRLIRRLNVFGLNQPEITLKAFLALYIQGNVEAIRKRNSELTDDDVALLMQKGADFFENANLLKNRRRALSLLDDLDKLETKPKDANYTSEKALLTQKLAAELTAQRHYKEGPSERIRACQVFEYLSNMRIRSKQIAMVQNIVDGKLGGKEREFIAQLIMGGGKSKVILPILALLLANGENLPILVVPKALIETQKQYMTMLSGDLFNQEANSFEFDVTTPFTLQHLHDMHDRLIRIINNHEYAIVTQETLEYLELKWVDCRKQKKINQVTDPQLDDKMRALGDILRCFRSCGIAILDEADTLLHVRKELHVTMTNSDGEPIDPAHRDFIASIYRQLTTNTLLKERILLCENKQVSQVKEHYDYIKAKLADHYADEMMPFDEKARQEFTAYVLSHKDVATVPECIRSLPMQQRDKIAILREELKTYLPITLARYGHQDYAYSKDKNVPFAIPAHHSEPVEGSLFGNHYEALNYTIQLVLQAGVPVHIIEQIISRLRQKAHLEMKRKALHETQAYKTFEEIYPYKGLFAVEESDWPLISAHVNSSINLKLKLAQECILSEIVIHPLKLSSDPMRFVSMFNKVYGFTGTPYNSHTYHQRLGQAELDRGTDGFTMALLMQKAATGDKIAYLPDFKLETLKAQEVIPTLIQGILNATSAKGISPHALIDAGALLKGLSLDKASHVLLEALKPKGIKGIVFFQDNQLVILEEGRAKPTPLELSKLKPEERFSIYDDPHTIGVDIVQKFNANGLMTISENILLKDLLQAVWRFRQLDMEQSITFLITAECRQVINRTLQKDLQAPITMEDILIFAAINQAKMQGEDAIRAFKMQVVNEIRDVVMYTSLQAEETDSDLAQEVFNAYDLDGIFSTKQGNEPFNQFGEIDIQTKTKDALPKFKQEWEQKVEAAIQARIARPDCSDELKQLLTESLAEVKESLKTMRPPREGMAPETMSECPRDNLGTEVQIQKKVEQKINTQLQLETQVMQETQSAKEAAPVYQWNFSNQTYLTDSYRGWGHAELTSFKTAVAGDLDLAPLQKLCDGILTPAGMTLLMSNNFYSKNTRLYGNQHKPINHVTIYRDYGQVYLGLISEDDEMQISPQISERRLYQGQAMIYDMRLNKVQCQNTSEAEKFLETPAFARALVVLKLLNAETDYAEEQEAILAEAIEKIGPENFIKLFGRIAAYRDSRNTFDGSVLQKVLAKALGKRHETIQLEVQAIKQQQLVELRRQKAELLKRQAEELRLQKEEELKRQAEELKQKHEQERIAKEEETKQLLREQLEREVKENRDREERYRIQNRSYAQKIFDYAASFFSNPPPIVPEPAPQPVIAPPPAPVPAPLALVPVANMSVNLTTILDLLKAINTQIANLILSPFRRFRLLRGGRPGT